MTKYTILYIDTQICPDKVHCVSPLKIDRIEIEEYIGDYLAQEEQKYKKDKEIFLVFEGHPKSIIRNDTLCFITENK